MFSEDLNEPNRLQALQAYDILDSGAEDCYDRLVRLAATLCGAAMAALSFVDARREWRKARVGLEAVELARADSLGARLVAEGREYVVPDLGALPLDAAGPAREGWRFYAGVPLVTAKVSYWVCWLSWTARRARWRRPSSKACAPWPRPS